MDKGKARLTDGVSVIFLLGRHLDLLGLSEETGRATGKARAAAREQNGADKYL